MRFFHQEHDEQLELSLDDTFIVPGYFDGTSRLDVDLTPTDFAGGSHPVVSANMNAVTGKRMAETMARYGGLGILPQDMSLPTVERIVTHIQNADVVYDTPLTVRPDATLRDVVGILRKRSHGIVIVVDDQNRPVGVISDDDLAGRDQYTEARAVMSTTVIAIPEFTSTRDAFLLMDKERVRSTPVIGKQGEVVGVLGKDDAVRMELLRPTVDARGKLMVGAAVGISQSAGRSAAALVEMGVGVIVVDTAHGHQRRMIDALREVKKSIGNKVPIVAGNVCTAEGTKALLDAGANIIKVNVGPGAMCTTRMQTGVGRPSFSSVFACARAAHERGCHVWADGGVRRPRDVALYLAAGASRVMVGSWLTGTYESPGDIQEDHDGNFYKENYGMASYRAVLDRTADEDAFDRAKKGFFREGISTSQIYLRPGYESVGAILVDIMTGVRSSFTYVGAKNIEEFYANVVVGVQTQGGFSEGTPHGSVRK